MADRITKFVDVVLPLAISNLYTYRVPVEWNNDIYVGQRVVVQFGKNKLYTALVRNVHENAPKVYAAKYILSILDSQPIVNQKQFELWEWIAAYYMCTVGEVMNAALPSGLKLSSETKIILNPDYKADEIELDDKEFLVVEALELQHELSVNEVMEITEQKTVHAIVKSLIEKGAAIVKEELKEKYKPKIVSYVSLTEHADKESNLKNIFDELEKKSAKQIELLMAYIKLSARYNSDEVKEVKKSALLKAANGTDAVLKSLVKKNIFKLVDREQGRIESGKATDTLKKLSGFQQAALDKIEKEFESKDIVLLHGVTSSGKTEIYVKLIQDTLAKGKQVLYLLPEIALTTQIINRLKKYFGEHIGVYHSKYNDNERVEVWKNVLGKDTGLTTQDSPQGVLRTRLIIGARSALFLPFQNIGLIIVDEEHDTSYKQYDPSPRYNARDTAIVLAQIHKAKTVLGSATPSIESYYNAQNEKYGLVSMTERFGGIEMPEIIIADIKEEKRKKIIKSHFSTTLLENITTALNNKEQVILFQNRRGFAPMIECETCAWTPMCKNCDVSLTYHKHTNQLRCHYCGYSIKPVSKCEACGSSAIKMKGFGTEKIEEELSIFFPEIRIIRMDLDTTRTKHAHQRIIHSFEEQEVEILVGTQMVTKGLDFDNVSVVGILNADSMLNYPDFRSHERAFQLMAQVSGRAGRKSKRGRVIIQTHNPAHEIIHHVLSNDYSSMYQSELAQRKEFKYPPFYRLIQLTIKHKEFDVLNAAAFELAEELKKKVGKDRILGPETPAVSKIKNLYLKSMLVKFDKTTSANAVKNEITKAIIKLKAAAEFKSIRAVADVDPF